MMKTYRSFLWMQRSMRSLISWIKSRSSWRELRSMSLIFSRGELADMRDVQEAHMMDSCLIAEPTITTDADNVPEESFNWNDATQSICGFNASPSKELLDQVPSSEAVVRLPIDTDISNGARVRITKRFGETQAS